MKIKLKIAGMHCTACALNIDEELEDVSGVQRAKTNYARQSVEVEYDPAVASVQALIDAVSTAGYTARMEEK